jgi:hypothetical protein
MAYLYRHIRLDTNEIFYIGIGSNINYKRAHSFKDRNMFWKNIINKSEYRVEIVLDDLTWEEACEKEKEFIALYGRRDLSKGSLCNLTNGGEGASGITFSEDRRKELSKKYSGRQNPFYGKKHSKKTIETLTYLAQNRSSETNKKISNKNKNKTLPEEVKLKISESTKGSKNHFYKKVHTEESKRKISEKAKGRVIDETRKLKHRLGNTKRIELYRYIDDKLYIFNSLREASQILKINRETLKRKYIELGFITKEEAFKKGLL